MELLEEIVAVADVWFECELSNLLSCEHMERPGMELRFKDDRGSGNLGKYTTGKTAPVGLTATRQLKHRAMVTVVDMA